MREIKFRAWQRNRLSGESYMHYMHDIEPISFDLAKFFESYDADQGGILLQYTGLKDKSGKEIYEGDIIKSVTTGGKIAIVEMDNGCWNANFDKGTGNVVYPLALRVRMDEVIGNIYENPELLEVSR